MYFEVSISKAASSTTSPCRDLAITDFDLYQLPEPPLKAKAGLQHDVLLAFKDEAEGVAYGSLIQEKFMAEQDPCIKEKYALISERLSKGLERVQLFKELHGYRFREIRSGFQWEFLAGNQTLRIQGPQTLLHRYSVNERRGHFYLDLDPLLESEQLRIQTRIDNQIELLAEFSGVIKYVLQPSGQND